MFIDSTITTDFEMKLKVTNTAYESDPSAVSPNSNYNNAHYTKREYTNGNKPNALGEIRLKMRIEGVTDYTSLTEDEIDEMFLLCYISK